MQSWEICQSPSRSKPLDLQDEFWGPQRVDGEDHRPGGEHGAGWRGAIKSSSVLAPAASTAQLPREPQPAAELLAQHGTLLGFSAQQNSPVIYPSHRPSDNRQLDQQTTDLKTTDPDTTDQQTTYHQPANHWITNLQTTDSLTKDQQTMLTMTMTRPVDIKQWNMHAHIYGTFQS